MKIKPNFSQPIYEEMVALCILLSFVFFGLAAIHYNWVFGGTFGFAASLPTDENGKRVLNPKPYDSAAVAIGLTAFGTFYLIQSGLTGFHLPGGVSKYGGWIIPVLFLLRAIGDFKYIGFFKKIKTTKFGKMDTKLFSPLCLLIGLLGMAIQLLK